MPGYRDDPPSAREAALADPAVPQVLKDLLVRIIPEQRFDDLHELVTHGAIDPSMVPENHPLMSPLSLVMSAPEPQKWLAELFRDNPVAMLDAKVPQSYYGPDINRHRVGYGIEAKPLSEQLLAKSNPLGELLTITEGFEAEMLKHMVMPRHGSAVPEPVFHNFYNTSELDVAMLDRLEKLTGGAEFLNLKNARGETMFFRIAANSGMAESEDKLDLVSWMLQRKPQLVNEPDRFGWTPLDRLISRTRGEVDSSMGRLLIVSGARVEKQMAAKFNVAAEIEERAGKRLEKPIARQPSLAPKS